MKDTFKDICMSCIEPATVIGAILVGILGVGFLATFPVIALAGLLLFCLAIIIMGAYGSWLMHKETK